MDQDSQMYLFELPDIIFIVKSLKHPTKGFNMCRITFICASNLFSSSTT